MYVFVGSVLPIKIAFKDIFTALLISRMIIPRGSGIILHLKLLLVKGLRVVHWVSGKPEQRIVAKSE